MRPGRRSMLLMAAFGLFWALVEVLAQQTQRQYSGYQVVWSRYTAHLALMAVLWGWREPRSLWHTRRLPFQLARSSLMLAMPACWIIALQRGVPAGEVAALFGLAPFLVLGLARIFLGEAAPAWLWLASALAGAGAWFAVGQFPLPPRGAMLFPLGAALAFSLYVVMTRSLRTETTRSNLFYTALGVAVLLTPVMPGVWVQPPVHDIVILAGVGVLGFLGLLALDRMAAIAPVSVSAPFVYTQLVFSLGLSMVLSRQLSGRRAIVGMLAIALVALVVWMREPLLTLPEPA